MKKKLIESILFIIFLQIINCASSDKIGKASYYADKFHGRKTASGEIFDNEKFTAAHKTLPFNTLVKVTSESTSKSVIVRINDRGPFVRGRVIDLSRIAAEKIDLLKAGIGDVNLKILGKGKSNENPSQNN